MTRSPDLLPLLLGARRGCRSHTTGPRAERAVGKQLMDTNTSLQTSLVTQTHTHRHTNRWLGKIRERGKRQRGRKEDLLFLTAQECEKIWVQINYSSHQGSSFFLSLLPPPPLLLFFFFKEENMPGIMNVECASVWKGSESEIGNFYSYSHRESFTYY